MSAIHTLIPRIFSQHGVRKKRDTGNEASDLIDRFDWQYDQMIDTKAAKITFHVFDCTQKTTNLETVLVVQLINHEPSALTCRVGRHNSNCASLIFSLFQTYRTNLKNTEPS